MWNGCAARNNTRIHTKIVLPPKAADNVECWQHFYQISASSCNLFIYLTHTHTHTHLRSLIHFSSFCLCGIACRRRLLTSHLHICFWHKNIRSTHFLNELHIADNQCHTFCSTIHPATPPSSSLTAPGNRMGHSNAVTVSLPIYELNGSVYANPINENIGNCHQTKKLRNATNESIDEVERKSVETENKPSPLNPTHKYSRMLGTQYSISQSIYS